MCHSINSIRVWGKGVKNGCEQIASNEETLLKCPHLSVLSHGSKGTPVQVLLMGAINYAEECPFSLFFGNSKLYISYFIAVIFSNSFNLLLRVIFI